MGRYVSQSELRKMDLSFPAPSDDTHFYARVHKHKSIMTVITIQFDGVEDVS